MSKNHIFKIYGISLSLTFLLLIIFIVLNHQLDGSIWQTMIQSKSALTAEYCELDQSSHFFRQTMNTYSNLMYFFLGITVVLIGFYDRQNKLEINKNPIREFPELSILFGACLIYLSIGSGFFHASLSWIGQRVDMNGTYSICITLIGISIYRFFYKKMLSGFSKLLIVIVIILIIILFIKIHLLISSLILLPALITLLSIFTFLNYKRSKEQYTILFAALSILLTLGAFVLRTLDVKKMVCNPTSFYQGHALWHFFTGMSAFMLYWFHRSEKT